MLSFIIIFFMKIYCLNLPVNLMENLLDKPPPEHIILLCSILILTPGPGADSGLNK